MKIVVLCGGLGTRLREETEFRPKPLVEVGGKPILWHIMKLYAHYSFRDFVLCLGYRGNMIKEYFLNYDAMNNDFTICLGQKFKVHYDGYHSERDPLERLTAEGQLMAYQHDGFFFAMDTYREHKQLNELWSSGEAPWAVWTQQREAIAV